MLNSRYRDYHKHNEKKRYFCIPQYLERKPLVHSRIRDASFILNDKVSSNKSQILLTLLFQKRKQIEIEDFAE